MVAEAMKDVVSVNGYDPNAPSKTVAQVLIGYGPDGMAPPGAVVLPNSGNAQWMRKVRLMRRDATLGLLRDLYMAAALASEWTVESDHPEFADAESDIVESTLPFRIQFLRDTLRGFLDFGWQPFEIVKAQRDDGTFKVMKYKGLLQDLSFILVNYYGELIGIKNTAIYNTQNPMPVYMYRGDYACMYRDAEGTNWYGEPLMRRVERPYDSWNECDDGARRFDVKIAGAHWVVYYPIGTSILKDANGDSQGEIDNFQIAQTILRALCSSGQVAIPSMTMQQVEDLNAFDPSRAPWRVELLSANTQQATFVERGRYLDSLKARGFGFPERSILEGQFGTKAEAGEHADFAIDNLEMTHREVMTLLNKQVINVLLELNWGQKYVDKVRVVAAPLADAKRTMLKNLYEKHWASETGAAQESDAVDWPVVREHLEIPVRQGQGHVIAPAGGPQDGEASPPGRSDSAGVGGNSRRGRYLAGLNGRRGT